MFLAGDIGGTKTRLALYAYQDNQLRILKSDTYSSPDHASLAEVVRLFVDPAAEGIRQACFGVAGPVRDGTVQITNLPWTIAAAALQAELGLQKVSLLNDLEANAYGIATLQPFELFALNPQGDAQQVGHRALISAGTGLGEAGLLWDGVAHRPFASEGGHSSFAPTDSLGDELLIFLRRELGHVSWERVLSGLGFANLYRFFRQRASTPEPLWLSEQIRLGDLAAVVSHAGINNLDPVCVATVDCFIRNYGAEAGNLALKLLALGGLYIGGGIAPRMLQKMQSPLFLEAFLSKGRMGPLLRTIPVYVILNDRTALQGAAWYAAHNA